MSILFIDLQYFPSINWFKKCFKYDHVVFFKYDRHHKMSFRNRMLVAGAGGPLRLSVPLVNSRDEQQAYADVQVQAGHWQRDHFRTLVSCYNRSPWFDHYRDDLAALLEAPDHRLFDFNLRCLSWVEKSLKRKLPYTVENALEACRVITDRTDDYRDYFLPASQAEWSVAADAVQPYTQVFQDRQGFIPGLSILDLLFCEGPSAVERLLPG
ncbi:MAG: WbqC family protein [Flavihumibacter sp.]